MTTQSGNQGHSPGQDHPENKHPYRFYWLTGGLATIAAAVIATLIAMSATHQSPEPVNPSPGVSNQSNAISIPTFSTPASSTTVQATATQAATRTITGNWSGQSGQLTLVITEVDLQGGILKLHIKAINNSAAAMNLPLFGSFVATDNIGETYSSEVFNSDWAGNVPANGTITGIVFLNGVPSASARALNVSFTEVFGEYAPSSGITVYGIPIPK